MLKLLSIFLPKKKKNLQNEEAQNIIATSIYKLYLVKL